MYCGSGKIKGKVVWKIWSLLQHFMTSLEKDKKVLICILIILRLINTADLYNPSLVGGTMPKMSMLREHK